MMNILTYTNIFFYGSLLLMILGFVIVFTQKNILKIILGLNIAETGVNILIVFSGAIRSKSAPIITNSFKDITSMVDPIPQALVLTSIVIGFGVTAFGLALAVRLYEKYHTLDISKIRGLKW